MDIHLTKFNEICEAYEVLSNPHYKKTYDRWGLEQLRRGVKDGNGICQGGYVYQKNCYEIFDRYFLTNNTFYDICDTEGMHVDSSLFGSAFGGVNQPKLPPLPNIEVMVPTTLKEFYNGCVKTINYTKQTVALDGKTLEQTVCNKAIEIKPGMDMHCNQIYEGEGHQQPG